MDLNGSSILGLHGDHFTSSVVEQIKKFNKENKNKEMILVFSGLMRINIDDAKHYGKSIIDVKVVNDNNKTTYKLFLGR